MSDTNGACEYVFDPDDPETWGNQSADRTHIPQHLLKQNSEGNMVWQCPYKAYDKCADNSEKRCIFHLNLNHPSKDNQIAINKLIEIIDSESGEGEISPHFLGAEFKDLVIFDKEIKANNEDVFISYSKIEGRTDIAVNIESGSLIFDGTKFCGDADFSNCVFGSYTTFMGAEFTQDAEFIDSDFNEDVQFFESTFKKGCYFSNVLFNGISDFRNNVIKGPTLFLNCEYRGFADFRGSKFSEKYNESLLDKLGNKDPTFSLFRGFDNKYEGNVYFGETEFNDSVDFTGCNISGSYFGNANLTDADLANAVCTNVNFEGALLSRAILFGADLRGSKLHGTVLGDIRINEDTKFLGKPNEDEIEKNCIYDPKYQTNDDEKDLAKAKSVYRALEELGKKNSMAQLLKVSFVKRQDIKKRQYWNELVDKKIGTKQRFLSGARWSRARVARATLLYGESPWRVIMWSLGIIFSFALLYPLGGWIESSSGSPITYEDILESVYFSTLTYTALGFGDFQPVGFGRLLTTVETGLGAVMLALLVFILGRRAAR